MKTEQEIKELEKELQDTMLNPTPIIKEVFGEDMLPTVEIYEALRVAILTLRWVLNKEAKVLLCTIII